MRFKTGCYENALLWTGPQCHMIILTSSLPAVLLSYTCWRVSWELSQPVTSSLAEARPLSTYAEQSFASWGENVTQSAENEESKFHLTIVRTPFHSPYNTPVSRKVVQLKSAYMYAKIPKGMMGCGCSLLHRQVHEFSAQWKAVL